MRNSKLRYRETDLHETELIGCRKCKLNHNKPVESSVDWRGFRDDITTLLDSLHAKHYIKEDLRKAS